MLPSCQLLEKVSREIKKVPNRRGEHLWQVHYGCYLLCRKSGLRVSEAVSFSLANKTEKGLYRIERPKGKKERLVYIPKKVIRELRKNNWKPNQTNRWNFYHFLKKIKRELDIRESIELTPHTLRHAFATYHAEAGLPLPLLQKLLGHGSIRTTALYWQNIYGDDDPSDILAGKNWLERQKSSQKKKPPITENFPEILKTPKPLFIVNQPIITNKNPTGEDNSLSTKKIIEKIKEILTNEISPRTPEKFSLNPVSKKNDQLKTSQPLAITTNKKQKPAQRELILLQKVKLLEKENGRLTTKLAESEKQKAKLEVIVIQEKKRADNYQQQLKIIAKTLYQLPKASYYQQLEKEKSEFRTQIIQPPPWKVKN